MEKCLFVQKKKMYSVIKLESLLPFILDLDLVHENYVTSLICVFC